MFEQEEWRDIPDWEGFYQASDLGRIKSLDRVVPHGRLGTFPVAERILRPGLAGSHENNMRWAVFLHKGKKGLSRRVHLLVLHAFVGPRPEGMEGCHNDGNGLNNRLDNLRWDTPVNNQHDRIAHGTTNRGERNGYSKLTESQVLEIRALAGSATQASLAKKFGTSTTNIGSIITRISWNHI